MERGYLNRSLSPEERARDLLARMTLREKAGQVNQRLYGFSCYERKGGGFTLSREFYTEIRHWGGLGVLYGLFRADPWSRRDFSNGVMPEQAVCLYNQVQKAVVAASRFGIPALIAEECPHGHQALGGYLLPVALAMGASFHPSLVERAFAVCGTQMKSAGVHLALISVLDVLRDPRWGRSEECFGEDPCLCSHMAAAAVRGCQGAGVGVVAKHFCAQGQTTGGVNASAAGIGSRELHEIHLPPAQAACRAGAAGIMAAYNEIDGIPCHANPALLRDILRGELGFSGFVMADGVAVDRLDELTGDSAASAAAALAAGVDVSLWDRAFSNVEEAVSRGLIEESVLDEAVLRMLTYKFRCGLFDAPFLDEKAARPVLAESPESLELARHSVVLLKNEGSILPVQARRGGTIALIGPASDDMYQMLGDYSPPLAEGAQLTLREALRRSLPEEVHLLCAPGCDVTGSDPSRIQEAADMAQRADLVILALGGSSSRFRGAHFDSNGAVERANQDTHMDCGEGVDCAELFLPGCQQELARAVLDSGTPVIALVVGGRPYAVPMLAEGAAALLYAFYPGSAGGQALADILLGVVSPGGRLPVSIPHSAAQLPCYYNPKASYAAMAYRNAPHAPLFAFGSGFGYTGFLFHSFELQIGGDAVNLCFHITNIGQTGGWAVPMLFIRRGAGRSVVTPRIRELKQFTKCYLPAGAERQIHLRLEPEAFCFWDEHMRFTPWKGAVTLTLAEGGQTQWQETMTR